MLLSQFYSRTRIDRQQKDGDGRMAYACGSSFYDLFFSLTWLGFACFASLLDYLLLKTLYLDNMESQHICNCRFV